MIMEWLVGKTWELKITKAMQKIAMRPIRYKYSLIVINNKAKKMPFSITLTSEKKTNKIWWITISKINSSEKAQHDRRDDFNFQVRNTL